MNIFLFLKKILNSAIQTENKTLFFALDINECTSGIDVCPTVSTCINTNGSYHCKCNEGYFQTTDYVCTGKQCSVEDSQM